MTDAVETLVNLLKTTGCTVYLPGCVPQGAPLPRAVLEPELELFPRWGQVKVTGFFTGEKANAERLEWLQRVRGGFGLQKAGKGWLLCAPASGTGIGAEKEVLTAWVRFPVLLLIGEEDEP